WRLTQWNVSEAQASGGVPGVGGSVFKLRYSHARQRLYDVAARVLGGAGALDTGQEWTLDRLSSLSYTIAAGTSQIQRNIVAERILRLPKGGR
ncbi:acyl-CoA dehydrogenase, partial [Streptomyces sp. SID14478]